MNRRGFLLGSGVVLTTVCAGCSSDETDGSNGDDGNGNGDSENGGDTGDNGNSGSGAADPKAAVETYIEAGQQDDSEAMSAIVHPDGTAPTSPDADGESTGEVSVNSISVSEESDTQASVVVEFDMTHTQDGEELTTTVETTYEVRTHEGSWFVYSRSNDL